MEAMQKLKGVLFFIIVTVTIIIPMFIFPSNINAAKTINHDELKFRYLTPENGLGFTGVKCFCEDQFGFLWIGGEGGLDRYDGNNILHFSVDPFDSTSLPDPIVNALHLDTKNRLWLGSSGGLTLFDYRLMSFSRVDIGLDSTDSKEVLCISETAENGKVVLWLSILDYGLIKFYPDEKKTICFKPMPDGESSINDNIIFGIHADEDNIIWLATYKGGLNRFDPVSEKFSQFVYNPDIKNSIPENHLIFVTSTKIDGEKTIWIGSGSRGLIRFNPQTNSFVNYTTIQSDPFSISNNRVLNIVENKGKLYLGTAGGALNVFDPATEKFQRFVSNSLPGSINSDLITSSYKSESGQIYFGTYENGISYIDLNPTGFVTIPCDEPGSNSLSANSVLSMARTEEGFVYAGNMKGIDIINEADMSVKQLKYLPALNNLVNGVVVVSLFTSKYEDNILWIGTFNKGLIKYNYKTGNYKIYNNNPHDPESISHNTVASLYEDSFGGLWFSVANYGINRLDIAGEKISRYSNITDDSKSLSSNYIMYIYEDTDSLLWVCTEQGINRYNRDTDNFTRFGFEEDNILTNSKIIASITNDTNKKNILWVASAAGLIKFDKTSGMFKRYTTKNGLAANLILTVQAHKESIWMCSLNGISVLNTIDESVINFHKRDGIDINEFNMTTLKSELIYFGGSNGLVYFNPDSIVLEDVVPEAVLTDFYLFNNKIKPGNNTMLDSSISIKNELVLSYKDYVFGFGFTAPNLKDFENQTFQYMLAGFHDEWIETPFGNRTATFTNIPPGTYEFRIRAAAGLKRWNDKYRTLIIKITPPFWKTWWAYTLYVLFSTVMLAGFVQWRTRKTKSENIRLENEVDKRTEELKKLNSDKDRFFSIVAHDIKSPLVAMLNFSKVLTKHYNRMTDQEKYEAISEIHESLNNSYRYLNNLLDWSRIQLDRFEFCPQIINIKEIVEKSITYLCSVAEVKSINLVSEINDDDTAYADYEMVSIVIRNLLSNGIKFTRNGGQVGIKCYASDKVEIKVCDSGVGIRKEEINQLFRIDKIVKTKGTADEEGTGLGLILCKELITKNNGEIFAESKLNEGSTFTVILPGNSP